MSVVAACANIALVKYWGKREPKLNLPARGSLSLTLDALKTFTEVVPTPGLAADTLEIDGVARSGRALDGHDAVARPVEGAALELGAAICVVDAGEKEVGSTDGMDATRETSPYHRAWLDQVDVDLHHAEQALRAGELAALTQVVEGSCLAMHANALAARPGIVYWQPTTLWAIAQVRALQKRGVPVMFTIDAGPHVVAFAPPSALDTVAAALGGHPEVARVIVSRAGPGLQRLDALPVGEGVA